MKQSEALDILKMGHNAFITGAAGSGKTHLLNEYIRHLREHGVSVGITASTGIAATHMGGITIHAWSGLGIRDTLTEYDLETMEEKKYLWKRFQDVQVLIIDEISMLHHFRLDLVDRIARFLKRNNKPFGGIQVILCGDFFQLPPVSRLGEPPSRFAYHADAWKNLNLKICYLEEQHRQNDNEYLEILNAIRSDSVGTPILERLKGRYQAPLAEGIEATRLHTHNRDVDAENTRELEKLEGETFEYTMGSRGKENLAEILKKGCLAPETLRIKQGARVMLVKNNHEERYANGMLGTVASCDDFGMQIALYDGRIIDLKPTSWKIEEDGKVKAEIVQYPIRLAWAITVHKSQGMSLDCAEIDLSQSFEAGMGYVALSRVRSLKGLCLKGLNDKALSVSEEVFDMDRAFREQSAHDTSELKNLSPQEITEAQDAFIAEVGGTVSKKTKKGDSLEETRKLFLEGKSVSEIAEARGLKEGTIIDHLEKLKQEDPDTDFSSLEQSFSKTRLKAITSALKEGGMEGGVYRLTPAKIILGGGYSFEEIRLARLLLK